MIPVNSAVQAANITSLNSDRRDNPSHLRVATTTVTEDDAGIETKRHEATRVIKEMNESRENHRDEERDPSNGSGQQKSSYASSKGSITDIYV